MDPKALRRSRGERWDQWLPRIGRARTACGGGAAPGGGGGGAGGAASVVVGGGLTGSLAVVVASARWVPQPGVGASLHVVGGILGAHLAETLLEGLDTALAEGLLQLLGERLEDLRRVEAAGSHLLALLQRHVLGLPFPLLLLLHFLLLHLCARLDVRDVLGEVIVEGLPRLIARGHLPEERPDGVPRIAPRHRLGEVAHVREQQILPGRLLHLPSLALDLQVDAVQQVCGAE